MQRLHMEVKSAPLLCVAFGCLGLAYGGLSFHGNVI